MNHCPHLATRDVRTRCYTGSVAREENRAAHGNICVTVECIGCGAARLELRNGRHEELGPWGPSRAEREHAHREALRLVPPAPAAVVLTLGDDRVYVEQDDDGMVSICTSGLALTPDVDQAIIAALPQQWVARAKARRAALVRAAQLASEVAP